MGQQLRCAVSGCIRTGVSALALAVLLTWTPAGARADTLSATAQDVYTYGYYTSDQLSTFGPTVSATVANGDSYAGVGSQVTGITSTTITSGVPHYRLHDPQIVPRAPIPSFVGSQALLLAGTNTSGQTQTITMAWRNRTDVECDGDGYPYVITSEGEVQTPPLAPDSFCMASDIMDIDGVTGSYVLQMTYDPDAIVSDTGGWTESYLAHLGKIYLGGFNDATQEWQLATLGNTTSGADAVIRYQGSFDSFTTQYTDFTPDSYLGSYGVDISTHTVWAVLDHNSEFQGVVPEPCSATLLLLGALGLLRHRRKLPLA